MKRIHCLSVILVAALLVAGCSSDAGFSESAQKRWHSDLQKIGELTEQRIGTVITRPNGSMTVLSGDGRGTVVYVSDKSKGLREAAAGEVQEAVYLTASQWPLDAQISAFDLTQTCPDEADSSYIQGDALHSGEVLITAWCASAQKPPMAVAQKIGDQTLPKPDSAADPAAMQQLWQSTASFIDQTSVRHIQFGAVVGDNVMRVSTDQGTKTDGTPCHRTVSYGKIWGSAEPSWKTVCGTPDNDEYFEPFDMTQVDPQRVAKGLQKIKATPDVSTKFGVHGGQYVLVLVAKNGTKAFALDELGV